MITEPKSVQAAPVPQAFLTTSGTRMVAWAIDHRSVIYSLSVILVIGALALFPRIQIDTDPENMLAADNPARILHDEIKHQFNLHDMLVVGIVNTDNPAGIYNPQSLSSLFQLAKGVEAIDGVIRTDLMSLAHADNITQAGPGTISFEWMMDAIPQTNEETERIRQAVARLPMLQNTLVSGDGQAAGIYIPIASKDQSYRISVAIKKLIEPLQNDTDAFYIAGLPVAEDTFGVEMFKQMAISAPAAGLTIFLLMFWFFRSVVLITAPMIVAMMTVIITMGGLIGSGFTVHIMSSMIPIFLMPIAVVDSVHLLSEFTDRYRPGADKNSLATQVVGHLFKPMLLTSITSAVGFASMLFTPIPPVQVFGAFVAIGIILAFIFTILFIPAYMSGLSEAKLTAMSSALHSGTESKSLLARWLRFLGPASLKGRWTIIAMAIALAAISIWGIQKIVINDNPTNWFHESHDIRIADRELNAHFSGTYNAFIRISAPEEDLWQDTLSDKVKPLLNTASENVRNQWDLWLQPEPDKTTSEQLQNLNLHLNDQMFIADQTDSITYEALLDILEQWQIERKRFLSPELLRDIQDLEVALIDSGFVGKVNGLPDAVSTVFRELKSGNPEDYRIPDSAAGVAQALLTFQSSHRPNDLWHMVTPDYRSTLLWLQLSSGDNQATSRVHEALDLYLQDHPFPDDIRFDWGGLTHINVVWQQAMVSGMLNSLLSSFLVVFVMMVILFRSFLWGLLAMLPLSITIAFIYGLIGIMGKSYDMPVAILSALTLGMSIDFAIHFIERVRTLHSETGSLTETMALMFDEPARAISRNAIVIALGFTPLLFAPLVPYQTVGVFLAAIMTISCLVTLVLLPALISLLQSALFKQKGAVE